MQFPQMAAIMDAVRDASSEQLCQSTLLIPPAPRAAGTLFLWRHQEPDGSMADTHAVMQGNLFLLWKKMEQRGVDDDLIIEGPPYDCRFPQDPALCVPETTIPVFCEEGQEYLRTHPEALRSFLQAKQWTFERVTRLDPKKYHGLERKESHEETERTFRAVVPNLSALDTTTRLVLNALVQGLPMSPSVPRSVLYGGRWYPLSPLADRCERYCAAVEAMERMNRRREGEAVARIRESSEAGSVAKVCIGAAHLPALLSQCSQEKIALCIVYPAGLSISLKEVTSYTTDGKDYVFAKAIAPQLRVRCRS
jgi:hypothetical protein